MEGRYDRNYRKNAGLRRNLKNASINEGFEEGIFQYAQQDERERVEFLVLQKAA